MERHQLGLLIAAAALLLPATAHAEESRAAALASEQAAKAQMLRPHQPGRLERLFVKLQNVGLLEPPVGIFPFVGSVMADSGVAAGPAVRLPLKETGMISGRAAWSTRGYRAADVNVALPPFADRRVRIDGRASGLYAPQVAFYGIGQQSANVRTNFLFQPTTIGLSGRVSAARHFALGAGVEHLDVTAGRGRGRVPSVEDRFTAQGAPGLGGASYVVGRAFAEFDWRTSPGYTTRGGLYRLEFASFEERRGRSLSFRRLDAEVQQHVPLGGKRWIIAVRGVVSLTETAANHEVPFYLQPSLGGSTDLRGFAYFRFRDRNRVLMTGEYRWTPSRFIDMALFYDAGTVAASRAQLTLRDLAGSYGIAARLHTARSTVLRLEVARGREGSRAIVDVGPAF